MLSLVSNVRKKNIIQTKMISDICSLIHKVHYILKFGIFAKLMTNMSVSYDIETFSSIGNKIACRSTQINPVNSASSLLLSSNDMPKLEECYDDMPKLEECYDDMPELESADNTNIY